MQQTTIEKVKLIKGDRLDIDVKLKDDDNTFISASESYSRLAHPDFKAQLQKLTIHLAILTGFVSPKQVKDINNVKPELTEDFKVTSYSIGGKEDSPGIVISGHKAVPTGGVVILNSPFKLFDAEQENRYVFMDNIIEIRDQLEKEVMAYMDGTKVGANPQGELQFSEEEEK